MGLASYGVMGVDWEERANFERLRSERLARAKAGLERSELGSLLCFDMSNIRYITATHIGMWAVDKYVRFCLLPQGDDPIMWDFGSAARHHKLYNPWLGEGRSRAGISTLRGSVKGRAEAVAEKIRVELEQRGLLDEPLGVDIVELPVLRALEAAGISVVDGQALMQDIRKIKTIDEITLLNTACAMVDAAYDDLFKAMKPGMRENECVALVSKRLFELGSEHIEGINAISGERCSPHPHVFTDRMLRPGDPAYFDILHSYNGYRTCYYRTFAVGSGSRALVDAYKRCRDILDQGIAMVRPGVRTDEVAAVWPKAEEFGFPDEEAAFALQYGHGVGLSSWEKPIVSRLVSFDYPEVIEEGMVFALETFWPASDGWQAARIEEQLVVTADGCEVITRFPAEELLVAGGKHYTVGGGLPAVRETPVSSEQRPARRRSRRVRPVRGRTSRLMPSDVIMPALGMAQETGKVLRWLKAEGEAVAKGEPLLEIETDKVTVELESPAEGLLAGIRAGEGAVVPVGETIAVVLAAGESQLLFPGRVRGSAEPSRTSPAGLAQGTSSRRRSRYRAKRGRGKWPGWRRRRLGHRGHGGWRARRARLSDLEAHGRADDEELAVGTSLLPSARSGRIASRKLARCRACPPGPRAGESHRPTREDHGRGAASAPASECELA